MIASVFLCRSSDLATKTRFPQLYVYDICLTRFGDFHQWMAFLEPDEYLVPQPKASAATLPEFLKVPSFSCFQIFQTCCERLWYKSV